MSRHIFSLIIASTLLAISACSTHMSSKPKGGSTLPGETNQLKNAGSAYTGSEYTIGIEQFDNKVPAKISGVAETAAASLKEKLETAGLKTIPLNENARLITLQQSDAVKIGNKDVTGNFDIPDYRLSGAITAYSEVEESIDAIVFQKKTVVARITVDYALVDIATGKPILAESGAGEYRKTIAGTSGSGTKPLFDRNLSDGALRDAINKITEKIILKLNAMPFQGKILSIDNQSVILKAGNRSQLESGTQLDVYHTGEAILDLESGKIIGYLESKIGVIEIKSHQNDSLSEASIISGSGIQIGDVAKQVP